MIRSLGRRCRGDLWSPAQWRPGLPAGACAAGAPISSRRNGEKEGPGGLRPPWTPQYGGSRRQALYGPGKNRACIHARFLFVSVTGAAAPWVARVDHPAGPDSRCAVPAWPAGPPSVLCRRNTLAVTAAHSMFGPHIARRAGACPRRPFRIRRRAGCADDDKGRTPAPDVRPSSKERGYNEMKRNCLLRV